MKNKINRSLISVIITTKNEESVLGRLLKSIKNQSYKGNEIIIVDNFSTDKTMEIAKKFTKNIYQFGPERSSQRNFGAQKSKGRYLLFLDADMELSKDVLKECVNLMNQEKNIGGIIIPEKSIASNFWEKVKAYERSFYNHGDDNVVEAARFFPKVVFNRLKGYDEMITGPEDWDLPERVKKEGFKIGKIFANINHYERIKSLYFLIKKKYYYGLTSSRYLNKHHISVVSSKTIYFLRPVFYRQWPKLLAHPVLSLAMFLMFILEMGGGGMGYIIGKLKDG